MGFYHRQFPMYIAHEVIVERYDGPEGRIPECLKAFPSNITNENEDDEFTTLKKLDDELNALLKALPSDDEDEFPTLEKVGQELNDLLYPG